MAYEQAQPVKGNFVAAADLRLKQYYFVKIAAGGDGDQVDVCSNVVDIPLGILQNKPNIGEEAEVCIMGTSKVSSDEALPRGSLIGTSGDGQAAIYVSGAVPAQSSRIVGRVLWLSGAAGEIATAVVDCTAPPRGW